MKDVLAEHGASVSMLHALEDSSPEEKAEMMRALSGFRV